MNMKIIRELVKSVYNEYGNWEMVGAFDSTDKCLWFQNFYWDGREGVRHTVRQDLSRSEWIGTWTYDEWLVVGFEPVADGMEWFMQSHKGGAHV